MSADASAKAAKVYASDAEPAARRACSSKLPSELSQINFDDPVDVAIFQAQFRFEKGEDLYKQGSLKRAKEEFDSAIDLILETAATSPQTAPAGAGIDRISSRESMPLNWRRFAKATD